ncbi:hypothetical protein [Streptomyces sp. NPDC047718]|uniref:hypothetical protein n=1 Tax=Streptomyces sp. NPDC047718 TaxID=3155479 RepID=UPI0033F10B68
MPQSERAAAGAQNISASPEVQSAGPVPGRLTVAHAVLLGVFPVLGTVLFLVARIPVSDILHLLGGCGLIGAGVTAAVTGGRRLAASAGAALAAGLLRMSKS